VVVLPRQAYQLPDFAKHHDVDDTLKTGTFLKKGFISTIVRRRHPNSFCPLHPPSITRANIPSWAKTELELVPTPIPFHLVTKIIICGPAFSFILHSLSHKGTRVSSRLSHLFLQTLLYLFLPQKKVVSDVTTQYSLVVQW
jgi:hypothetical protein